MKWITAIVGLAALVSAFPAAAQNGDHRMRIKLAVPDLKRAIEFYGILGMKPGSKHTELQLELNWPGENAGLLIVGDPKLGVVPGASIMITVPDVKATADQLRKAGFPNIGEPTNLGPARLLVVKDNGGNSVQLLSTTLQQPRP